MQPASHRDPHSPHSSLRHRRLLSSLPLCYTEKVENKPYNAQEPKHRSTQPRTTSRCSAKSPKRNQPNAVTTNPHRKQNTPTHSRTPSLPLCNCLRHRSHSSMAVGTSMNGIFPRCRFHCRRRHAYTCLQCFVHPLTYPYSGSIAAAATHCCALFQTCGRTLTSPLLR